MKHLAILFLLLASSLLPSTAQPLITLTDSVQGEAQTILLPEHMALPFDSLIHDWHVKHFLTPAHDCSPSDGVPLYPDSVYIERLQQLPTVMEMTYCEPVRKMIDLYCGRMRKAVAVMLGAANFYFPIFEEALESYNLPLELKYLPIIESSLKPTIRSRAGASGLWQFMLKTGRLYGLESNSLVDERCDPIKASYAAARYLKDLYNIFQDWNLVIAAYNCGPGNVNKAIHRAGGSTDYWTIYPYLPRETQGYVPSFIAANYVMHYYCKHNICPMDATLPLDTDTVQVNRELRLSKVAEVCGLSLEEVQALNPQYRRDLVPGNSKPCTLRLPEAALLAFIDAGDSVYTHPTKPATVTVKEYTTSAEGAVYHRIRNGENLGSIARKYHTSVRRLQQLNNLQGTNIRAGRMLRVK